MSDGPDWQDIAMAYDERIHVLERIAIADQQSYRELQVENENLKHRLSMAESNNPDSVLSKHNAMLMACKARDELKADHDKLMGQLAELTEKQYKAAAMLIDAQLAAHKAESERDTALRRAEQNLCDAKELDSKFLAEWREKTALQAKVARAVALLEPARNYAAAIPMALEALR